MTLIAPLVLLTAAWISTSLAAPAAVRFTTPLPLAVSAPSTVSVPAAVPTEIRPLLDVVPCTLSAPPAATSRTVTAPPAVKARLVRLVSASIVPPATRVAVVPAMFTVPAPLPSVMEPPAVRLKVVLLTLLTATASSSATVVTLPPATSSDVILVVKVVLLALSCVMLRLLADTLLDACVMVMSPAVVDVNVTLPVVLTVSRA